MPPITLEIHGIWPGTEVFRFLDGGLVMRVCESVELFLAEVEAELSAKTHKTYSCWLVRFCERFGGKKAKNLKPHKAVAWFHSLKQKNGKPYASDSVRAAIVSLVQWDKYAKEKGHTETIVFSELKKPQGRQRNRIPTRREQSNIIREAKSRSIELARILRCSRYTGARPSELTDARIEEYDREIGMIVRNKHKTCRKTGEPRYICIGDRAARIVARCIGNRTEGYIFLNRHCRKWTAETLSHAFRSIRDELGLTREIVLYSFRHAAGTEVCEKYGLKAASIFLGHASCSTTERYVHINSLNHLKKWQRAI